MTEPVQKFAFGDTFYPEFYKMTPGTNGNGNEWTIIYRTGPYNNDRFTVVGTEKTDSSGNTYLEITDSRKDNLDFIDDQKERDSAMTYFSSFMMMAATTMLVMY